MYIFCGVKTQTAQIALALNEKRRRSPCTEKHSWTSPSNTLEHPSDAGFVLMYFKWILNFYSWVWYLRVLGVFICTLGIITCLIECTRKDTVLIELTKVSFALQTFSMLSTGKVYLYNVLFCPALFSCVLFPNPSLVFTTKDPEDLWE